MKKFIVLLTAILFALKMQAQKPQETKPDSVYVFYSALQLQEEYTANPREFYMIVDDTTVLLQNAFIITRWSETDDLGYYPDEKVITKVSAEDINLWPRNDSKNLLFTWISNTWETRQNYIYNDSHNPSVRTSVKPARLARDKKLVQEQHRRFAQYKQ